MNSNMEGLAVSPTLPPGSFFSISFPSLSLIFRSASAPSAAMVSPLASADDTAFHRLYSSHSLESGNHLWALGLVQTSFNADRCNVSILRDAAEIAGESKEDSLLGCSRRVDAATRKLCCGRNLMGGAKWINGNWSSLLTLAEIRWTLLGPRWWGGNPRSLGAPALPMCPSLPFRICVATTGVA